MALPYFPFYAEDWLAAEGLNTVMTLEHEGAYIRLLARMWAHAQKAGECFIPDDDAWVAGALRVTAGKWGKLRTVLVDGPYAVFRSEAGRLVNDRLVSEWKKAKNLSQSQSKKAAGGWEKRREEISPNQQSPDAGAEQQRSIGNARTMPDGRPIDPTPQNPEKTLGTIRPQTPKARLRRGATKPTAFDNEDARSAATVAYDALKGMGVSNIPPDWFQKAVGAANKTLTEGDTPPPADELRAAIAWAASPERAQFKRGKILARQFGLLVADYQAARADDLHPAQARASPRYDNLSAIRDADVSGGGAFG